MRTRSDVGQTVLLKRYLLLIPGIEAPENRYATANIVNVVTQTAAMMRFRIVIDIEPDGRGNLATI